MSTKKLTKLALFMALQIALESVYIPVGMNLQIMFTFFVAMFVASEYSYPTVFIYAILEDVLGFFLSTNQGGGFFPGYTLTAVVAMSLYWVFLHKEVNLKNIIFAKTSANIIANILLNSVWSATLYSKGFIYYLSKSVVKNLALLPLEIIAFYAFYKLIKPLSDKYK